MSTFENAPGRTFPLLLPADPDLAITVYDGHDQATWRGVGGDPALDLRRGLYTVRVESNGIVVERIVRLTGPVDLRDMRAPRRSAAPLADSALHRDYYEHAARKFSLQRTCAPLAPGRCNASLLVLVRALDKDSAPRAGCAKVGTRLSLRDGFGFVVSDFGPGEVERDDNEGWMAFSVDAPAGMFRLASSDSPAREVPVYLFRGYQTQVFIPEGRHLALEAMRVLLEREGVGFQPDSEVAQATDAALEGIMNRSRRLPKAVIEHVLKKKFDNPLFRLIAAYAQARRLLSWPGTPRQDDNAVKALDAELKALDAAIPNCPDLIALHILRDEALGRPPAAFQLRRPPMFRFGLNAVVRSTLLDGERVPEGCLLDRISDRMLADSPWSSWSALPSRGRPSDPEQAHAQLLSDRAGADGPPDPNQEQPDAMSWLQNHLLITLQRAVPTQRNPARPASNLSLVELARSSGTTPSAVRRALRDILKSVAAGDGRRLASHAKLLPWLESDAGMECLRQLIAGEARRAQ